MSDLLNVKVPHRERKERHIHTHTHTQSHIHRHAPTKTQNQHQLSTVCVYVWMCSRGHYEDKRDSKRDLKAQWAWWQGRNLSFNLQLLLIQLFIHLIRLCSWHDIYLWADILKWRRVAVFYLRQFSTLCPIAEWSERNRHEI